MADVIISNSGSLVINGGSSSMPKGGYTVTTDGSLVYVKAIGSSTGWKLDPAETTLDGASFSTPQDLVTALSDFSRGGTGPGSGVQSVTGDGVGGTAENPVISYPDPSDIGAATSAQGGLADTALQPADKSTTPVEGKVAEYTNIGSLNVNAPQFPENAVPLQYLNASLTNRVKSEQESGVGVLVTNIIQVTQAEYDGLTPVSGTFYVIVG